MNSKKIDRTKLLTVANYAFKIGKTTTWVYKLIKEKEVQSEKIDGVIFVKI